MSKPYDTFDMDINDCAQMDADTQGHFLTVLAEYRSFMENLANKGHLGASDWALLSYELGNMEGRLFCNCWTLDDYERASEWEQEMEERHEG